MSPSLPLWSGLESRPKVVNTVESDKVTFGVRRIRLIQVVLSILRSSQSVVSRSAVSADERQTITWEKVVTAHCRAQWPHTQNFG